MSRLADISRLLVFISISVGLVDINVFAQDSEDRSRSVGRQLKNGIANSVTGAVDSGAQIIGNTLACAIAKTIDPNSAECQERRSLGGSTGGIRGGNSSRDDDDDDDDSERPMAGRYQNPPQTRPRGDAFRSERRRELQGAQVQGGGVSADFLAGYWCVRGGIGHFLFRQTSGDTVVVDSLNARTVPIVQRISQVAGRVFRLQSDDGRFVDFEQIGSNTLRRLPTSPEVLFQRCDASGRHF